MASVGTSEENVSLNIMPMLDIFSILILFLLMNFSTDPLNHQPQKDIVLPESITLISLDEVPAISVTKKNILLNGNIITSLTDGDAPSQDITQGAIKPLFLELKKLAEASKRLSKNTNNPLTLEIDRTHDFKLIKKIMLSSQQADFVSFKLMVLKQSE